MLGTGRDTVKRLGMRENISTRGNPEGCTIGEASIAADASRGDTSHRRGRERLSPVYPFDRQEGLETTTTPDPPEDA
jgi:hypothetical protein